MATKDHTADGDEITPATRTLTAARRVIPLAGVSLEAFRECPEGFPRYADNPTLSATVNNYLRENGLPETPARQVAETITAGGTNM